MAWRASGQATGRADWLIDLQLVLFQVTTCLGVTASFLRSLPALPSVTLILTSWTRRHSLSSRRAGQYSGSPPRRPYSSSLRSILYEGSPYMSSPIHSSLLPSFVPFSSIVTSWSSQTPSKYHKLPPLLSIVLQNWIFLRLYNKIFEFSALNENCALCSQVDVS